MLAQTSIDPLSGAICFVNEEEELLSKHLLHSLQGV
jgi:hypothetical protein